MKVTTAVASVRAFKASALAALKKKEQEKAREILRKSKIGDQQVTAPGQSILGDSLAKYFADNKQTIQTNLNIKWSVPVDLHNKDVPTAVMIPAERMKAASDEISALEYFDSQKEWVAGVMKEKKRKQACAAIVRPAVERKVRASLGKLGSEVAPLARSADEIVNEAVAPQFYQLEANGFVVAFSTEFGMVECRATLGGSDCIMGVPWRCLRGDTMKAQIADLHQMTADCFLKVVREHGLICCSKGCSALVIPCGYALVTVNLKDKPCHGIRWLMCKTNAQFVSAADLGTRLQNEHPDFVNTTHTSVQTYLNNAALEAPVQFT